MIIIHNSNRYTIRSHGNGAIFLVSRKADEHELFLQGDDAVAFGDALDNTSDHYQDDDVCAEYDHVMRPA